MREIKGAYIGYVHLGVKSGLRIKTFKNSDATNSYTVDHVHKFARGFNFLIGRFAHFSERFNKPFHTITLKGKDLAKSINCSFSHAGKILSQFKEIFDLDYDRKGQAHGPRNITLNKRVIEFLKIYSELELQEYIEKYDLHEYSFHLSRIFERKIWDVAESQLTPEQRKSRLEFIDIPEIQNYHHEVHTSNKSEFARIKEVEKGQNKLNDTEENQFKRIKQERAQGKLSYYLYKVLIKLEQKITFLMKSVKTAFKPVKKHSLVNGNQEKKETVAHERATAAAVKDPEEDLLLTPKQIVYFFSIWNHMSDEYAMNKIKRITVKRIKSINELVKNYNKEDLFKALRNIKNLPWNSAKYEYRMKFDRFIQSETFLHTLEYNSTKNNDNLESIIDGANEYRSIKALESSIPNFIKLDEAVTWFNEKN